MILISQNKNISIESGKKNLNRGFDKEKLKNIGAKSLSNLAQGNVSLAHVFVYPKCSIILHGKIIKQSQEAI